MTELTEPQRQPFPTCPACNHGDHGTVCRRGVYADHEFTECKCLGVWADAREVS